MLSLLIAQFHVLTPTQCGPILSHDDLHRGDDLLGHRRGHGGGVQGAVRVVAQIVDQLLKEKFLNNVVTLVIKIQTEAAYYKHQTMNSK